MNAPSTAALLAQAAAGPHRPSMGLVAIAERDWLEPGPELAAALALKRRLLAERHDEVFAALPESAAASAELTDLIFDFLPRRFPTLYPRMGDTIAIAATSELVSRTSPALHPLDIAGRIVAEDLCVMQRGTDGMHRLTAASLCFPSRWRLAEKLGRPLGEIHAPVPAYAETLARPVERFFAALADGRIVARRNWTIHDRPDWFQPQAARHHAVAQERFAADLFLRSERQTLRRLPASGAIVFTIGTEVTPLGMLPPAMARDLGAAIAALPAAERGYKGLGAIGDALAVWLQAR